MPRGAPRPSSDCRSKERKLPPVGTAPDHVFLARPMATTCSGVLEMLPRGGGFLRDPAHSFQQSRDDAFVPDALVRRYGLVEGAFGGGWSQPGRQGPQLGDVELISGLPPDAWRARTPFAKLVATSPNRRFRLGDPRY